MDRLKGFDTSLLIIKWRIESYVYIYIYISYMNIIVAFEIE